MKPNLLSKEDWIFLSGLVLTFFLVCLCIYRNASVVGVGIFAAVVLGHKVASVADGKFPEKCDPAGPSAP